MFTKALRVIGDLDDEFYADEWQRDVWNEASAIGFQLSIWVTLLSAAVLPMVAGRTGAWVALGLLVAWVVVSLVVIFYARARGVDIYTTATLVRGRGLLVVVVYLIAAVGVFVRLKSDADASTWAGYVVGGLAGAGAALWGMHRHRRREAEAALVDDIE